MFGFLAAIFSLVWIQEHLALFLTILGALIALVVLLVRHRRKRRQAYLALPVQFIGNKATKTYHAAGCPQLARILPGTRIAFRLPQETARMGYSPCGSCRPRWPQQ